MNILEQASYGATVGQADLGEVTNALTAALKTGVKGTEDFEKAMGTINATVGAGQMHFEDLTESLGTGVLNTFRALGLSLTDFGAALATMTARGENSSTAANRLNMALIKMVAPTKAAKGAIKELGLGQNELFDAMQGPRGLPTAIKLLKEHYDDLVKKVGKAEAFKAIATMFPRGAVKTIFELMNATDDLGGKFDQIKGKSGDFMESVAQSMDEPINKIRKSWSSLQASMIQMGVILAPIAAAIAEKMAAIGDAFDGLSPRGKQIVIIIAAVAAAVGPLLIVLGTLATSIAALLPVLAVIATPVGAIVVALVALGVAIAAAVLWPDKLKQALMRMGLSAKDAETVVKSLQQAFQAIKAVVETVWPAMQRIIVNALTVIKGIANVVMGLLQGDWDRVWKGMKQIVDGAVRGIVAIVIAMPATLGRLAILAGKALYNGLKDEVAKLPGFVKNKLGDLKDAVIDVAKKAPAWGAKIGEAIAQGVLDGVTSLPGALGDKLISMGQGAIDKALGVFGHSPQEEIGVELVKGTGRGVDKTSSAELAEKLEQKVKDAIEKAKGAVRDARGDFASEFGNLATEALSAFDAAMAQWKPPALKILEKEQLQQQKQQIKDDIKSTTDDLKSAKDDLAQAIAGGDPEAIKAAQDKVAQAEDAFNNAQRAKREFNLQQQANRQQAHHDLLIAKQRVHLQNELEQLQRFLAKHPEAYERVHGRIKTLLGQFGVDMKFYGTAVGVAFAAGLKDAEETVVDAMIRLLRRLEALAKLHSDAKRGPLSDLSKWWKPFVPTLLEGVNERELEQKAQQLAGAMKIPVPSAPPQFAVAMGQGMMGAGVAGAPPLPGAGAIAGGAPNVYVTVEGSVITEQDLALRIRDVLTRRGQANGGGMFGGQA